MIPVIICGGSGSRLEPLASNAHPKQFVEVFGEKTLFEQTIERMLGFDTEEIIIVSNERYKKNVEFFTSKISKDSPVKFHFIYEPVKRNTAPAIALALEFVKKNTKHKNLFFVPSDHLILDNDKFYQDVKLGLDLSNNGKFVVFGLEPKFASTEYGYIEYKNNDLISFKEKPNFETAKLYVEDGRHLWNSGMFLTGVETLEKMFKQHASELYQTVSLSLNSDNTINKVQFEKAKDISIDYALLEHERQCISVIKANFEWYDVGSFDVLANVLTKDANGNTFIGGIKSADVKNCLVISDRSSVVSLAGISDCIIVVNAGDVLVCKKGESKTLKTINKDINTRRTNRPWGFYEELAGNDHSGFKVKRICVFPSQKLSYQMHHNRQENWVVTKGFATVILDDKEYNLTVGESIFIPIKAKHRLINKTEGDVEIMELQTGCYLGEDDIVRFEDDYGR